jgi:hypothetical protein
LDRIRLPRIGTVTEQRPMSVDRCGWQREAYRRPVAQFGGRLDLTPVGFDQVAHGCQAERGAAVDARTSGIDAIESLEDARSPARIDPDLTGPLAEPTCLATPG